MAEKALFSTSWEKYQAVVKNWPFLNLFIVLELFSCSILLLFYYSAFLK